MTSAAMAELLILQQIFFYAPFWPIEMIMGLIRVNDGFWHTHTLLMVWLVLVD
jgi:hypothetical protein